MRRDFSLGHSARRKILELEEMLASGELDAEDAADCRNTLSQLRRSLSPAGASFETELQRLGYEHTESTAHAEAARRWEAKTPEEVQALLERGDRLSDRLVFLGMHLGLLAVIVLGGLAVLAYYGGLIVSGAHR